MIENSNINILLNKSGDKIINSIKIKQEFLIEGVNFDNSSLSFEKVSFYKNICIRNILNLKDLKIVNCIFYGTFIIENSFYESITLENCIFRSYITIDKSIGNICNIYTYNCKFKKNSIITNFSCSELLKSPRFKSRTPMQVARTQKLLSYGLKDTLKDEFIIKFNILKKLDLSFIQRIIMKTPIYFNLYFSSIIIISLVTLSVIFINVVPLHILTINIIIAILQVFFTVIQNFKTNKYIQYIIPIAAIFLLSFTIRSIWLDTQNEFEKKINKLTINNNYSGENIQIINNNNFTPFDIDSNNYQLYKDGAIEDLTIISDSYIKNVKENLDKYKYESVIDLSNYYSIQMITPLNRILLNYYSSIAYKAMNMNYDAIRSLKTAIQILNNDKMTLDFISNRDKYYGDCLYELAINYQSAGDYIKSNETITEALKYIDENTEYTIHLKLLKAKNEIYLGYIKQGVADFTSVCNSFDYDKYIELYYFTAELAQNIQSLVFDFDYCITENEKNSISLYNDRIKSYLDGNPEIISIDADLYLNALFFDYFSKEEYFEDVNKTVLIVYCLNNSRFSVEAQYILLDILYEDTDTDDSLPCLAGEENLFNTEYLPYKYLAYAIYYMEDTEHVNYEKAKYYLYNCEELIEAGTLYRQIFLALKLELGIKTEDYDIIESAVNEVNKIDKIYPLIRSYMQNLLNEANQ